MGFVTELKRVAANRTVLYVGLVGALIVQLSVNRNQWIIANEFFYKRRWVLFRSNDIHAVLCASKGNIEQTSLFCVFNAEIILDNVFEHGIFLNLGREPI